MGCGRTAWPLTCVLNCPSLGTGGRAAFGSAEASDGAAESPGKDATATP